MSLTALKQAWVTAQTSMSLTAQKLIRRKERKLTTADLPERSLCGLGDLQAVGVHTAGDLWRKLAAERWALDGLLTRMNAARPVPLKRTALLEVVTTLAERDAARLAKGWRRGVSQLFVPLLFAGLLFIAWKLVNPPAATRNQVTVVRAAGIPPYHLIGRDDVREKNTPVNPLAASSVDAVVGRYATRALTEGELVRTGDLKDGTRLPDLNGRTILTIPVGHFDGALSASLPAVVTLLFSDAAGTGRERHEKVYLLALAREPAGVSPPAAGVSAATVAVPRAALDAIHPLLSARSVTVAWDPPR